MREEVAEIAAEYGKTADVVVLQRREGQSVYHRVEEYIVEESTED